MRFQGICTSLSVSRFINLLSGCLTAEIPDFLDPLECDFIAAMAERKGMRDNPKWTNNNGVIPEDPEHTFRKWDFNRNGFIDNEDVSEPGTSIALCCVVLRCVVLYCVAL